MTYRVYSGPKGSGEFGPIEKSQLLFKQFSVFDEALSWARHVERTGHTPLLIEGDDGTACLAARLSRHCASGNTSRSTVRLIRQKGQLVSRFHSARARSVRWSHFVLTTSQLTIGRWAPAAISAL
jgi:hypothetical protein